VDVDVGDAGLDEGAAGSAGHGGVFPALPHVAFEGGEVGESASLGRAGQAAGEPIGFGVQDAAGGGPVPAGDVAAGPVGGELVAALVDAAQPGAGSVPSGPASPDVVDGVDGRGGIGDVVADESERVIRAVEVVLCSTLIVPVMSSPSKA
jgi:hypothetical protein